MDMRQKRSTPAHSQPESRARRAVVAGALGAAAGMTLAGTATGRFEVLHASPDAPPIDVYLGARLLQTGLTYQAFSKRYITPAGQQQLRVFAQGADPNGAPLIGANLNIEPGQRYIIAVCNRAATLEVVPYLEAATPAAGQTTLRFIHLEPGRPNLDVLNAAGGAVIIDDIGFKAAKTATIPAGAYTLQIRQRDNGAIIAATTPITLGSAQANTLFRFAPAGGTVTRAAGSPEPATLVLKPSRR
jgi:Domain of unknown function (DUF4397)